MQIHARIKYPRTLLEANRIISYLDRIWVSVATSPRGRQRSRNFTKLIRLITTLIKQSDRKSTEYPEEKELHQKFNGLIKDWARKKRLPIRWQ